MNRDTPNDDRLMAYLGVAEHALTARDKNVRDFAAAMLAWPTSETADLEAHLGLSASGRHHARQRLRYATRDAALRHLWTKTCPDLGPTAAGWHLAGEWHRYAANSWPRDRRAGITPADDPDRTFAELLAAGHDVIGADRLRRILAGSA